MKCCAAESHVNALMHAMAPKHEQYLIAQHAAMTARTESPKKTTALSRTQAECIAHNAMYRPETHTRRHRLGTLPTKPRCDVLCCAFMTVANRG